MISGVCHFFCHLPPPVDGAEVVRGNNCLLHEELWEVFGALSINRVELWTACSSRAIDHVTQCQCLNVLPYHGLPD